LATTQEEFEALCFEFGIELDDVVSISPRRIPSHSLTVLRVALSEF
jgi:hypothetical protein